MMKHDDATARQVNASQPDKSTWLSANAGSGKTKVLTDRVARLLLEGIDPQNVLCLTYTKAAASEMQNRLFATLGKWAMLPNQELETALETLGHGDVITNDTLRRARRLFAAAIETPGGLKIQTIHSFCSALLRKFPFEAEVTPNFTEMEERAAALLRSDIVEAMASGPDRHLIEAVAPYVSDMSVEKLTASISGNRAKFSESYDEQKLRTILGLGPDISEADVLSSVFLGDEAALLSEIASILQSSSANDQRDAAKLRQITGRGFDALAAMEALFLHGKDAKRGEPFTAKIGNFGTKNGQTLIADLLPRLDDLMRRVEAARPQRLGLITLRRTTALQAFAAAFLSEYEKAKMLRGWLDFDDLILKARTLLSDSKVADWVLYRLDGRIDHILVDEAQDTSPEQWKVIECLANEFTSGEGTKTDVPRTIFVVGDKKQSIYSFQGADPREFDRMKEDFGLRLENTGSPLQDMQMEVSFRSAPVILKLVDRVFEGKEQSGFSAEQQHIAFKSGLPGRVDLWDLVEQADPPEDPAWYDPVDIKSPDNPNAVLAEKVAQFIQETIGTPLPCSPGDVPRLITEGDFLILVRKRSDVFHDIIRACKSKGLSVAGADRLKVGAELAVKDLKALLSVLATPEDDLALASALRSPLFGWSEGDLFDLAHDRKQKYLAAELRDRADEFPETAAILNDLRGQVDYLRPYDLIDRILTRHDGRRKLLGRLGKEAEDGIDALLSQALSYERNAVDSLTGFLVWMETDDLEIKRQLDTASDQIRVMTVHGAKGLEAPIVIMPDTAKWVYRSRSEMVETSAGMLWKTPTAEATPLQKELDSAAKETDLAERDRLLYVGMTRAEQWLIVAAAGELGKDGESWHDTVRDGMAGMDATEVSLPWSSALRVENGNWDQAGQTKGKDDRRNGIVLPSYFRKAALEVDRGQETLSPSDLGGAKALPDERGLDEEAAKRRGRQVHRLLEVLPDVSQERWLSVTKRLLATGPDPAEDEECRLLLGEVRKVLEKPSLAEVFATNALTEVAVSADLDLLQGQRIHGIIDRLVLSENRVLAVDFKTNAMVPQRPSDCPDGLLRQMGAYAHALAKIYPDREINTAFLWTRTATIMHLPHDLVTDALRTTYIP